MYAEKLLVHDRGQRESTERVHARIVDLLRVLMLAFELEGEIVCQVATLVVAA